MDNNISHLIFNKIKLTITLAPLAFCNDGPIMRDGFKTVNENDTSVMNIRKFFYLVNPKNSKNEKRKDVEFRVGLFKAKSLIKV